jgi:uncharacterized protein YdeI (BOF family)
MRIACRTWLFLSLIVSLASCQKEVSYQLPSGGSGGTGGSGNTNNITGDYDFVGLVAHTRSDITVNAMGQIARSITVSDYVSQDNTGTVKITSNQFISDNLGYSIDTIANVKSYIDNSLVDDSDVPFSFTLPPTSSTSTYVRNSTDSITVTGAIGTSPDPTGNTSTGPTGAKLSWSGDTLILNMRAEISQTITQGGIPAQINQSVIAISKLKKRS